MSTTAPAALSLPPISEIDRADEKLCSFKSDLDSMRHEVEVFANPDVPIADAVFMMKTGVAFEERPRRTDPATLARLLVFADEVSDHAEAIRGDAEKLRQALLTTYRFHVIEPSGRYRDG